MPGQLGLSAIPRVLAQTWEPEKYKHISTIPWPIQWSIPILEPPWLSKSHKPMHKIKWLVPGDKTGLCFLFQFFFHWNSPLKLKSTKLLQHYGQRGLQHGLQQSFTPTPKHLLQSLIKCEIYQWNEYGPKYTSVWRPREKR